MQPIKIVDLFAGPGGLGEGFSSCRQGNSYPFRIALSVEKNKFAHATLRLRSFWRLLKRNNRSVRHLYAYYKGLKKTPWTMGTEPLWHAAESEALNLELGKEKDNLFLFEKLGQKIPDKDHWVLIGGPPCQAYSS